MDNSFLHRVEDKLDGVVKDIGEVKVVMARNTTSLEEHIKRTNELEKKVIPLWNLFIIGSGIISIISIAALVIQAIYRIKS